MFIIGFIVGVVVTLVAVCALVGCAVMWIGAKMVGDRPIGS